MQDAKGKTSHPLRLNLYLGLRENQQALSLETPLMRLAAFHFVVFPQRNENKNICIQRSSSKGHKLKTSEAVQFKCNVVSI